MNFVEKAFHAQGLMRRFFASAWRIGDVPSLRRQLLALRESFEYLHSEESLGEYSQADQAMIGLALLAELCQMFEQAALRGQGRENCALPGELLTKAEGILEGTPFAREWHTPESPTKQHRQPTRVNTIRIRPRPSKSRGGVGYRGPHAGLEGPLVTRSGRIILEILNARRAQGMDPVEAVRSVVGYHRKTDAELEELRSRCH